MLWRVLDRYGYGTNPKALMALAVTCCLFTAGLEAGFMWVRRGYELAGTLRMNFIFAPFDLGIQPSWQVLAFGLVFALGAAARAALRVRAASLAARQAGYSARGLHSAGCSASLLLGPRTRRRRSSSDR